jgi:hypothetical protein
LNVLKQHHAHINNTITDNSNNSTTSFELSLPDTNRTKWQAFQALHSGALASDKKVPWTVQQDNVLFQTVAASGPQHVMDQHFAHSLSSVLKKHPKAILQRTTTSLLNPSFDNHQWSDTDERRLCLLMKVYRDSQFPFVSAAVRIIIYFVRAFRSFCRLARLCLFLHSSMTHTQYAFANSYFSILYNAYAHSNTVPLPQSWQSIGP